MTTIRKTLAACSISALFVFNSPFSGSVTAGEYKVAMCKDRKLCNYVLKIINEDLKAAETVRYNERPDFLKWEKIDNRVVNPKNGQNHECFFNELSVADINGDNKSECLIRLSAC